MFRFLCLIAFMVGLMFAKVDINTASADEFATLKGIGKSKAEAIVKYRDEHGAFKTIDELVNVNGIGKKTVEKLRDDLTIDGKSAEGVDKPKKAAKTDKADKTDKPKKTAKADKTDKADKQ
ncbi:hypothetical protein FACS189487_10220 [Campylobacterota bacterium]|nr:hypothetical protein FACS189487_10220 [Campylobacterota bacterium]